MAKRLPRWARNIEKDLHKLREQEKLEKKADIYQKVDVNVAYDYSMSHFDEIKDLPSEEAFEQWLNTNNFKVDNINRGKIWFTVQQKKKEEASKAVSEPTQTPSPSTEESVTPSDNTDGVEEKTSAKIDKFWIVTKKITDKDTLQDILFERDMQSMELQFLGGLKGHEIVGVYTDYKEALAEAEKQLGKTDGENSSGGEGKEPIRQPEVKESNKKQSNDGSEEDDIADDITRYLNKKWDDDKIIHRIQEDFNLTEQEAIDKVNNMRKWILSSSNHKEAAKQGELKEKDTVIHDETGLKGQVTKIWEDKGFVQVMMEDNTLHLYNISEVELESKIKDEEKPKKKVFEGNPDELKDTKLHDKNTTGDPLKNKPKGLEVPENIPPSPEDVTIAFEDFKTAQNNYEELKKKVTDIVDTAKKQAEKLSIDNNLPGLKKQVEQSVNILASIMEKENTAIVHLGDRLIALESHTDKEEVKTNADQIKDIQKQIEKLNEKIIALTGAAEPIAKDIETRIVHIWEKTREQKKESASDSDTSIKDIIGDLYEGLRGLYLDTKGIISDM